MKTGEKAILDINSDFAYGDRYVLPYTSSIAYHRPIYQKDCAVLLAVLSFIELSLT